MFFHIYSLFCLVLAFTMEFLALGVRKRQTALLIWDIMLSTFLWVLSYRDVERKLAHLVINLPRSRCRHSAELWFTVSSTPSQSCLLRRISASLQVWHMGKQRLCQLQVGQNCRISRALAVGWAGVSIQTWSPRTSSVPLSIAPPSQERGKNVSTHRTTASAPVVVNILRAS